MMITVQEGYVAGILVHAFSIRNKLWAWSCHSFQEVRAARETSHRRAQDWLHDAIKEINDAVSDVQEAKAGEELLGAMGQRVAAAHLAAGMARAYARIAEGQAALASEGTILDPLPHGMLAGFGLHLLAVKDHLDRSAPPRTERDEVMRRKERARATEGR